MNVAGISVIVFWIAGERLRRNTENPYLPDGRDLRKRSRVEL